MLFEYSLHGITFFGTCKKKTFSAKIILSTRSQNQVKEREKQLLRITRNFPGYKKVMNEIYFYFLANTKIVVLQSDLLMIEFS